MAAQTEQVVLWNICAKVVNWEQAEFVLYVPRIREGFPRVDLGDVVHFRQVAETEHQGTNVAFEGRICALRKREGLVRKFGVFVHLDKRRDTYCIPLDFYSSVLRTHLQTYAPLKPSSKVERGYIVFQPGEAVPFSFNVTFILNARPFCLMEAGVSTISKLLVSTNPVPSLTQQWLFPEKDHDLPPAQVSEAKDISKSYWIDKGLNAEQRVIWFVFLKFSRLRAYFSWLLQRLLFTNPKYLIS